MEKTEHVHQLRFSSIELAAMELDAAEALVEQCRRRVREAEGELVRAYARLGAARRVAEEKKLL